MDFSLPWDHLMRLGIAAFLGMIMGIERDWSGRPAGVRTNLVIAVGSCLFTILSIEGFSGGSQGTDTSRVAAQIVSGLGFLGAGIILQQKNKIIGLTTAADVWLVAAVGMAVGTGFYMTAAVTALATALLLQILHPFSDWVGAEGNKRMRRKGKPIVRDEGGS